YFKLEFSGVEPQVLHCKKWVQPKARLSVLQADSGFYPKPKIGEFVAKTAFFWNSELHHISGANKQNIFIWRIFQSFYKNRNIFRKMLAIAVDGYCEMISQISCEMKTLAR